MTYCDTGGKHASWAECLTEYASLCAVRLELDGDGDRIRTRFLAEGVLDEGHFAKIAAHVDAAERSSTVPVLVDYDNRTENLCLGGEGVVVMDWGLAMSGIGLAQEMVKISGPENKQAFLDGYGIPLAERADVLKQRDQLLVLEGLALCRLAVGDNVPVGALRHWFESIARITSSWE